MNSNLNNLAMLYGCWLLDSDGCDLEGLKKRHLEYVEAAVQYFFDRFDSEIEVDDEQSTRIREWITTPLNILLDELESHYYVPQEPNSSLMTDAQK